MTLDSRENPVAQRAPTGFLDRGELDLGIPLAIWESNVGLLRVLDCGVTLDSRDASAGFQLRILDFGSSVAELEF